MISFEVTKEEMDLIQKIATRAKADVFDKQGVPVSMGEIQMDLCATIAQGVPLRLDELLAADAFNFAHDIVGIYNHLNRTTGKLENFFLPRFFRPSSGAGASA